MQRFSGAGRNASASGRSSSGNSGKGNSDSLGLGFEHRDDLKDSITITYKFLDSIRSIRLDTTINDFYKYYE